MRGMEPENDSRPQLVIEIPGAGVSPGEVSARELAEILTGTAQLLESLGAKDVRASLIAIEPGSAKYAFCSTVPALDDRFGECAVRVREIAENRGQNAAPAVRSALLKIHRVTAAHGGLRIAVRGAPTFARDAVLVAPPLELVSPALSVTTVLHGHVVGVEALKNRYVVWFKPEEGPKLECDADARLALLAGRLFSRSARASVRLRWDPVSGRESDGELVELEQWTRVDVLDVFDAARREAEALGTPIDGAALLESVFSEDD